MQIGTKPLIILLMMLWIAGNAQTTSLDDMLSQAKSKKEDINQVDLLISISDSLSRKQPADAVKYATEAFEMAKKLNYELGKANSLKFIGMGYFMQGDYVMAVNYFQQALEDYEAINFKPGIANMLNNLGVIYNNQGSDSKALEVFLKSLKLSEEVNDSVRIVTAMINIGLIYSKKPATVSLAEGYYIKALPISEKIGYQNAIGTVSVNLGELYFNKGDYTTALSYFEKSLKSFQISGSGNTSYSLMNIGKIYSIWNDYESALKYQHEALKIAQNRNAKLETSQAHIAIANIYFKKGEFEKSLDNYIQAEKIAKEIGALSELLTANDGLSSSYSGLNDYKNAFKFKNIAYELKDTVHSVANQLQISQLQIQSEIETMFKENEILKLDVQIREEKSRQQWIVILFLFLGFISISLFMIFLVKANNHKKKVNAELSEKNELITQQKQEITDSILYASRIQKALLTPQEQITNFIPENFILFRPRDIVSGDFYWMSGSDGRIVCMAADCTGHGVPGAFMSMLGISFLNEIISRNPGIAANELLNELRNHVVDSLRQGGGIGASKDGMDVSLLIIDRAKGKIEFAGANNPLIMIRNNELIEYKPDKMPIGYYYLNEKPFTNNIIDLYEGDMLYLFSDGYIDQFGGANARKFMIKNFRTLLLEIHNKDVKDQKQILEQTLADWMGYREQIDDILVVGIRA